MASQHRKIFVNLAVDNLDKTVDFFTQLGFEFDEQFTDKSSTCMVISNEASVMLHVKDRFKDFTTKAIADPTVQTEAILCLSADSRGEVDELADKALAIGGQPANEPSDQDSMYERSFHDLDGHMWEVLWMDPSSIDQ